MSAKGTEINTADGGMAEIAPDAPAPVPTLALNLLLLQLLLPLFAACLRMHVGDLMRVTLA